MFLTRNSDQKWVYSFNPLTSTVKKLFHGYEENNLIPENLWNKITLLAYYGYNYDNHTDLSWYFITQFLIWKEVNPNWDIYFMDQRLREDITSKYEAEIQELYNLISNHNTPLMLDKYNYQVLINESIHLTDPNLSKFNIKSSDNIEYNIQENSVTINPIDFGLYEIEFYKNFDYYQDNPILYVNNQDLIMAVGKLPNIFTKININIHAGKIYVQSPYIHYIYQIYDQENNLIEEIITDENGFAESNYLPNYGNYYLLNPNHEQYQFTITEDNLNQLIIINNNEDKKQQEEIIPVEIVNSKQNEIKEENIKNDIEYLEIKVPITEKNIFKPYKYQEYLIPKYYEKKKKR